MSRKSSVYCRSGNAICKPLPECSAHPDSSAMQRDISFLQRGIQKPQLLRRCFQNLLEYLTTQTPKTASQTCRQLALTAFSVTFHTNKVAQNRFSMLRRHLSI